MYSHLANALTTTIRSNNEVELSIFSSGLFPIILLRSFNHCSLSVYASPEFVSVSSSFFPTSVIFSTTSFFILIFIVNPESIYQLGHIVNRVYTIQVNV